MLLKSRGKTVGNNLWNCPAPLVRIQTREEGRSPSMATPANVRVNVLVTVLMKEKG